jgi:hypothetical protein
MACSAPDDSAALAYDAGGASSGGHYLCQAEVGCLMVLPLVDK